ncbi:MAG: hypothetical protein Q9221_008403 [Calogaya cf. arnoldii]
MSLAGVAFAEKVVAKKDMPNLAGLGDPHEIMDYNMTDSAAAAQIWVKTRMSDEIFNLAAWKNVEHVTLDRPPVSGEAPVNQVRAPVVPRTPASSPDRLTAGLAQINLWPDTLPSTGNTPPGAQYPIS